jgi:hypothetical protein
MTRLLEQAIAAVSKLPEAEQDALARALLDEIGADERWDTRFAQTRESLADLADEAIAEHRAGKTKPLDPDTL